jgi:hypothetical protein
MRSGAPLVVAGACVVQAQWRLASTLVVADHDNGAVSAGTLSAITAAGKLGGATVLVAGHNVAKVAEHAGSCVPDGSMYLFTVLFVELLLCGAPGCGGAGSEPDAHALQKFSVLTALPNFTCCSFVERREQGAGGGRTSPGQLPG